MKITFKIVLCLIAVLLITSCKKSHIIKYPGYIFYGDNILSFSDGTSLQNQLYYGMGAELGKKAKLKIVMTNLSVNTDTNSPKPGWGIENNFGWIVSDFGMKPTVQTFEAMQRDKIDLGIIFINYGQKGSCKIEYYENSNKVTKTKYLNW